MYKLIVTGRIGHAVSQKMGITKDFGNFIANQRHKAGISQSNLASSTNISRSTLAKIEIGETSASLDTAQSLLNFFNQSFTDFDNYLRNQNLESKVYKSLKSKSDQEKILKQIEEL